MHERTPSNVKTAKSTKRLRGAIQQNELESSSQAAGASTITGPANGSATAEDRPVYPTWSATAQRGPPSPPDRPIDPR